MAEDKLSGKAGLDTTNFKTGIAEMNRELRVLESGFRASAAGLADWANDATGLETRIKSLSAQMEIQERKVAATRAEYERMKAEKGENSRAAQDLEIKLNKEVETLGKMENELQNTEASLQEMKTGTDEAGESVDDLGDSAEDASDSMVTFGDVMEGTKGIAAGVVTVVAGLVATVGLLVGAIGGLVFSAADAAGQLVDLSTKTGISTTRLQELQFIGNQVGTSLDTITGAQARLVRSMATAAEQQAKFDEQLASGVMEDEIKVPVEMAAAFNGLGVAFTDASGNLRDQQEVFDDVIDALGKIENPAERDALAMEIFGKSAQELNPLIKAGSAELARLTDEAHDMGAVMDEDAVAGLEAFGDTMTAIQDGIKGTLGSLAGEFLPVFEEVATALQDLFKSDEFKRGIQEFSKLIQGVVSVALDVLSQLISGDFEGALASIFGGDAAATIVQVFGVINDFIQNTLIPFVTTHAQAIKTAVIGIGTAFAAFAIIGTVVGWITGLIATITALSGAFAAAGGGIAGIVAILGGPVTLIVGAVALAIGLLAAAWSNNWGGIRDTLTQIWEGTIKPALEQLWEWLSTNIPAALRTLSNFWTNVLLPAIQRVWSFLNTTVFPLWRAMAEFLTAVFGLALRTLSGIWTEVLLPALRGVWEFLSNNVFPIFQSIGTYIAETFRPILDSLGHFISTTLVPAFGGISGAISGVIDWLIEMAEMLNNLVLPDWLTPGSPTPWEIGLIGINKAMQDLNRTLPVLAKGLNLQPQGAGGVGLGGSSVTNNESMQFFAPVIIQGDTTPGSLGAALKGKRY